MTGRDHPPSDDRPAEDLTVAPGQTWDDLAPALHRLVGDDALPDDTDRGAVVLETSGSSGTPKRVRISGWALRASGLATAKVLGGHGRWVLALPTHHVAGFQVLARSALAGTTPVALDPGMPFTPAAFAAAVEELGERDPHAPLRLVSLVPTQLARLVADPDGVGVAALRAIDAVLLGGAAADPGLLARARDAGARVVTTYGMSETAGGCVYDGTPLPGVRVRIDPADDRIHLGGPVLADGYVGEHLADLAAERFQEDADGRWFVTDDRGRLDPGTGRLTVLGRVDDVIVTGGHKVEPRDVEEALQRLPGVADALVVGVPDPEWGHLVAALLVPGPQGQASPDGTATATATATRDLKTLRAELTTLPAHARPRRVAWRDAIPLLPSGKPDRASARDLLAGR